MCGERALFVEMYCEFKIVMSLDIRLCPVCEKKNIILLLPLVLTNLSCDLNSAK